MIAAGFAAYRQEQGTAGPSDDRWEPIVRDDIPSGRSQFFVAGSPMQWGLYGKVPVVGAVTGHDAVQHRVEISGDGLVFV